MAGELLNHARGEPVAAHAAAESLAEALGCVIERHYDPLRRRFDYGAAAVSEEFRQLRGVAAELAGVDPAVLTGPNAAKAWWINVYNALVIHIILTGSIAVSVRERDDFFTGPHYCIGGQTLTPDAIEHGILRANARKYMGLSAQFARGDPRLEWALTERDPRIHFMLYTGAASSPLLRVAEPDHLDAILERATREHLEATVEIDPERDKVRLPAAFRWYTGDFGGSLDDALAFVRARRDGEHNAVLARDNVDVEFQAFDWRLNDRYAQLD